MKVSVVIPAYNAMTYLPETLESVLRQTFTDFEVLIVDDGSSDQVVEWASGLVDPRVKLIKQENQGAAEARNTGIAHAQGEYVAFLDADDLWEPTKLEKQVRCLEDNPAVGLVNTWTVLIDQLGNPTGRAATLQAEGDVWKQIVLNNFLVCSSVMVRRCCFESVGVFERNLILCEDWDMWIRIASRYSFAVVKEPLVYYRQHLNNTSKNYQTFLQDSRTVIEKAFQSVPSELLYLRNRSYGYANLYLAWRSLKSRDYEAVSHFRQQAIAHYSQLRYSWDSIRLSIALAVMHWFGPQGYDRVRSLTHALRQDLSNVAQLQEGGRG
jgi:glycosyltransferase involved in cell wall biosynthesis